MMTWPLPPEEPQDNPRARPPDPDTALSERVTERLRRNTAVGRQTITVRAQQGVVLLGGTVDSPAAREAAWRTVRDIAGVRDVCNMVQVSTSTADAASWGEPFAQSGRGRQGDGPRRSSFDDIAARLLAQDPSLARLSRTPRSRALRISLAVLAVSVWGLVSVLLVVATWLTVVVLCAVAAIALEVTYHRRAPGHRTRRWGLRNSRPRVVDRCD